MIIECSHFSNRVRGLRKVSGLSSTALYGRIDSTAVIGGAIGTISTMFYTGIGIFRKLKGPKTLNF